MSHPQNADCIAACDQCAASCDFCAISCLQEPDVQQMTRCIQLDLDCADLCRLTSALMARNSPFVPQVAQLCAQICEACAAECAKHPPDHCQDCAESCKTCAEVCSKISAANSIPAPP